MKPFKIAFLDSVTEVPSTQGKLLPGVSIY